MKKPSSRIREEIARLQDQLKQAETREAQENERPNGHVDLPRSRGGRFTVRAASRRHSRPARRS